jgi:TldD protein
LPEGATCYTAAPEAPCHHARDLRCRSLRGELRGCMVSAADPLDPLPETLMTQSASYRAPFAPGGSSGIDPDLCRKLLGIALARGGDYADLFFEYRAGGGLSFEEGITRNASRGVSMGLGVRVQRGDATGYAHVEDLSWEAMKRAAETAARIASGGAKAPPARVEPVALPKRYELDPPSIDVPGLDKRRLLERASEHALKFDSRIVKVEASLAEEVREILIATSDGQLAHDVQPLLRFGIRAIAESNGRREAGRSGGGGRTTLGYFDDKSPEWHAEQAARQALVLLDARGAPAGQMEVVLAPGDSGILLHEAVGHGLEADFNRKGTSNYTGRVGQPVASELCTVVDDATFIQGRGSINVDDEGVEPQKSVLIENGVLTGYMQDRLSARHFRTRSTGNGRRESYAYAPMPRMTNTVLLAGPDDPEEIVKSVKRGVFAKTFGGGQVDISNGDFVFSLTESYLIEDGRITAPLKGVNLIGNGPETLRHVSMLGHDVAISDGIWTCGKDGQSVPVGVGCPTIKIAWITVGGTEIG